MLTNRHTICEKEAARDRENCRMQPTTAVSAMVLFFTNRECEVREGRNERRIFMVEIIIVINATSCNSRLRPFIISLV